MKKINLSNSRNTNRNKTLQNTLTRAKLRENIHLTKTKETVGTKKTNKHQIRS